MDKETPNYYGIIPAEVRYSDLTPRAILLYSELTALTNAKGYCWASNQYFANLYNTSEVSVSKWISSLVKKRFIKTNIAPSKHGISRKIYLEPLKENFKTPLKENFKYNNKDINTKSIINNTKESKDSLQFKSPFIKKCILDWNEIPFTQNIRVTRRTKTITKLERYIAQLLNGTFTSPRGNKAFDEDWFDKNKVPIPFKKLTKKEILVTIKKTSLYGKEGYFTENKSYMPKDLAGLMYNPRTGKSWFLLAYHRTPKPFNNKDSMEDPEPKTSNYLFKLLKGQDFYTPTLYYGVKSIREFVDNIPAESLKQHKIRSEVGTPLKICKEYVYWLEHQDWIDEIKLPILNANNKAWKMFIREKEEEYQGYKLQ